MMKTKYPALVLLLMMFIMVLAGCGKTSETKSQTLNSNGKREINIAYQNGSKIVLIAKAKGWYEEEFGKDGVDVKYSFFLSGPPMMEAFSAGRMDFGTTGDMPPVSSRAAGVDLKIISRASKEIGGSKVLVRPDSPINSVQDLKGKKVATQIGSGSHHFIVLLLKKHGLDISNINLVNLGATEFQNALANGNVDAVVTWEPWGSQVIQANAGRVLIDSTGIKNSPSVMLVRNEFATQNPDLVERFLKVNQRVVEYIKQNPDEALNIISKETKLPVAVLANSYKRTEWSTKITNEDIEGYKQVKDFLLQTNIIKKDFDINTLFDLHYLKNIGIE